MKKVSEKNLIAIRKNTPRSNTTEINEHAPRHLYRKEMADHRQSDLPLKSLPARSRMISDDESELSGDLARLGAGDRVHSGSGSKIRRGLNARRTKN